MRRNRKLPTGARACLLVAALGLATAARAADATGSQPLPLSLGKGGDAKARAEPAEVSYLSDASKGSSYGVQAALIWAPQATFGLHQGATWQWDLALGLNKNTVSGDKRVDKVAAALGGRLVLDLGPEAKVQGRGALERRRNRLTDGDESAFSTIAVFNIQALKKNGPLAGGAYGYDFKPFPFVGVYRTDTAGNTGATALNGHYGAPVVGLDLNTDLAKEGVKGSWIALDISLRRQFERWVSGDFKKASYGLDSIALKLPFNTGGDSKGAISLVHTRGTDRIAGEPWKRQTALKLTLKFGNA